MGIRRINIDQQFAEIGVRTPPAKLNIRMPRGQLSIKNERPQMQIDRQKPSFNINLAKINSEMGLKAPLELAKNFRNDGKQAALKAAGQAKNDGNFLAQAGRNMPAEKVVPQLAKSKANARLGPKEYNIGLMPETPAEISWNKGYMRINWSRHSVVIDYSGDYKPDISVDPKYSVEVYLRKEPYFRVMVEEAVSSSSRYVNRAI